MIQLRENPKINTSSLKDTLINQNINFHNRLKS